jgi:hypothetical protein
MNRWRLLEKRKKLECQRKEMQFINDSFLDKWNTREMIKEELRAFGNRLNIYVTTE